MMNWKFWKRKPQQPEKPIDLRIWNEDWQIGDIAECIEEFDNWHDCMKPWDRPKKGQRLTVSNLSEDLGFQEKEIYYYLTFADWHLSLPTQCFRKVRPVGNAEESEICQKILNVKSGPDKVRKTAR